jgi:signal peptidase II
MSETEDTKAAEATPAVNAALERYKWKIFAIVGVLSLIADQVTKVWARHVLPLKGHGSLADGACAIPDDMVGKAPRCFAETIDFIDGFWQWRLSMNPGSAFGLFGSNQAAARIFLSIVGIAAVGGMVWMVKKARTDQKVLHWALAFVAGGAVGNLIDRIYFGYVTDMVLWRYKTHEWPVFNVADVVLVIGVGLMFIDIQKESKREKALKKAAKQEAQDAARAKGHVKY